MNKIPYSIWIKMIFIVVLNLAAIAWVFGPLAKPAKAYAVVAAWHVSNASVAVWQWGVDSYEELPSFGELKNRFIEILKKPIN